MAAAAVASTFVSAGYLHRPSLPGCRLKPSERSLSFRQKTLSLSTESLRRSKLEVCKRQVAVQASYSGQSGRTSSASIFVGGFILGGIVVGTLGCVFAPQISKALAGADRKDLMRKLPKFIYDEEKALEKTRKVLAEKIAQLNSAIDDVSSQLRADDGPNGAAVASDEVEAAI